MATGRLFVGLIALLFTIRLPALLEPRAIDDEAVYAVAGVELAAGGQIYVSAVERKPPLLLWTYGAIAALAGPYPGRALHLISTLWIAATMLVLFVASRQLFGSPAGLATAMLYGLYQQWGDYHSLAFNGEVLMNLPIACGCAIAFRRSMALGPRLFVAGVFCGAAFLFKQPGAVAGVALGVYPLLPSFRGREQLSMRAAFVAASTLAVGALAPLLAVAAVLWQGGLLREAWYWTILDHDVPHVFWQHGVTSTLIFAAVCLPLLLAAAGSWRQQGLWAGREPERHALVVMAVLSTLGAFSSGRFYLHYYIAIVLPLALLGGPSLAGLWRSSESRGRGIARAAMAVYAATAAGFLIVQSLGLAAVPRDSQVARYLRAETGAADRIFVWGRGTHIYLDAKRRPASRYIATFALTGRIFGPASADIDRRGRIRPGAWDNLMRDFETHPPAYVVDLEAGAHAEYPVAAFPPLARLLSNEYDVVIDGIDGRVHRRQKLKLIRTADTKKLN